MCWELRRYTAADEPVWNEFVGRSRNATFLHDRRFMDYHADRFNDFSIVATLRGKVSALLPANVESMPDGRRRLVSHRGLTYGGWLLPKGRVTAEEMLELFEALVDFLRSENFGELIYRPVPHIYTSSAAQEDEYALWRLGAVSSCVNLSAAADLTKPSAIERDKRRQIRRAADYAEANGLVIKEFTDSEKLVSLIEENLDERYGAKPVHTATELELLRSRFPKNIRYWGVFDGDDLLASACIFIAGPVAHAQYTSSNARAREHFLLSLLIDRVMGFVDGCRWFDFGTSNEERGRVLNPSLFNYKFSFGGGGVLYPEYTLTI